MVNGGAEIQPDKNWAKVHNSILELLATTSFTARELRCLLFLLRMTYGYQCKDRAISLNDWTEGTQLKRPHVFATLQALTGRNVIVKTETGKRSAPIWAFNKYFEQWLPSTPKGTRFYGTQGGTTASTQGGTTASTQGGTLGSTPVQSIGTPIKDKKERKKETYTPGSDYFGMKRPRRGEQVTADGYTQDAATEGVDAETFRGIFDTLIDAAGWRRLVDAGDDTKLGYAKREALMLIRMGTKTTEQTAALVDAYRAAHEWRTNPPKPSDIATYASQLADKHELPPAPTNGIVRGFSLSDMLGD